MLSIDLIRENLRKSAELVLLRIEDMEDHALVAPTPRGGGHTLWTLGHLTYIEGLVVRTFMLGEPTPRPDWAELFDGDDVSAKASDYPPFHDVLAACRGQRQATLELIQSLSEEDLDRPSQQCPKGHEDTFGTYRHCLQFVADHGYMHRGQLADARRAAGLDRMWF